MNPSLKESVAGLVRHALTTGGGYLTGAGILEANQAAELTGAGMVVFGVAWSLLQKYLKNRNA